MTDNTDAPVAERWRALAEDSHAIADTLTDPDAHNTMRQIAKGYERLALHAEQRETIPVTAAHRGTGPQHALTARTSRQSGLPSLRV